MRTIDLDPNRRVREYSHGNKRKVGLIAALMHEPELLKLDEPTGGLDPLVQQAVLELVREAYSEALKSAPESVEALIGMGSTYAKQGYYESAANYYYQAMELEEQNPDAHWGIAISLISLGRSEDAFPHLEKVRELAPNSSLAREAENLMLEIHPKWASIAVQKPILNL